MVKRGAPSSRIHRTVSVLDETLLISRVVTSAASDTFMCRNEKCAVSRPPSQACAQLHCCSFLETKTCEAGSVRNSSSGIAGMCSRGPR